MQQSQKEAQMKVWVGVGTMHNKIYLFTRAWCSCNVSLVHCYRITRLVWLSEHLLFINCIKSERGLRVMVRRDEYTEEEELYSKKPLKLILLKIFFHSKIGCRGLNYQSSALTISQRGIWKVSMFLFVWSVLSLELSIPVTTQSLQIRCYWSVHVFCHLSVHVFWYSAVCYLSVYVFCLFVPILPTLTICRIPELPSAPFQHQTEKCKI